MNNWLEHRTLPILRGPLRGKRWLIATRINFFLGTYETLQTDAFLAALRPGNVVYDIGAHYGYYTLLASSKVREGHVFAFEPSPHNLLLLRRHLALNDCRNVTVLDLAVSEREGQARFENRTGSGVGHLSPEGPLQVRVTSLDALAARLPAPNIIKIDVEGAELSVLNGSRKVMATSRPIIFLSTHGDEMQRECRTFLQNSGYLLDALESGDFLARYHTK